MKTNRPKVYETTWRNKFLTMEAKSFDEMISMLQGAVDTLKEMREAGVQFDPEGGTGDDYVRLFTTDEALAKRFGLHEEPDYDEEDAVYAGDEDGV